MKPGPPATITLTPAMADNPVDSEHCVTATVREGFGSLVPGATVNYAMTGSTSANGSAVTDADGQASFCYTGPALPGSDVIRATAEGGTSPTATAAKNWLIPPSTTGCKVNTGGRITAANGDKATFGGNARADGAKGQIEYLDHGPAVEMNVHSTEVLSVVCGPDGTSASIFCMATVNGSGMFNLRVDVRDPREPGEWVPFLCLEGLRGTYACRLFTPGRGPDSTVSRERSVTTSLRSEGPLLLIRKADEPRLIWLLVKQGFRIE